MKLHFPALLVSLTAVLTLSACSPEQNWRDVTLEGGGLKFQLPCKPDRTARQVSLANLPLTLQVAGCESGTAIVALMSAALPPGADASAVMLSWQQATLDNARVEQPLAVGQSQAWHRPGQLPLSASVRVQSAGQRANGEPVRMDAVWGAVAQGERMRLVHAVVYDRQIAPELANTLFESIRP